MIAQLIIFLLVVFTLPAGAEESRSGKESVDSSKASSVSVIEAASESGNSELLVLRAQLSEARIFQSQILSTVYWSLGTLAGVAVILVTYGWWTNFRVYERDKETLERELRSVISESVREANDEHWSVVEGKIVEFRKGMAELLEASEERSSHNTDSALEKSNKLQNSKIGNINAALARLESEVRSLHLADQLRERLEEVERGSYRNALQSSVSALELANKTGDEYEVGEVLDLISEDISKLLESDKRPVDNFLVGQLTTRLGEVEGRHAHSAAALKAKAPQLLLS